MYVTHHCYTYTVINVTLMIKCWLNFCLLWYVSKESVCMQYLQNICIDYQIKCWVVWLQGWFVGFANISIYVVNGQWKIFWPEKSLRKVSKFETPLELATLSLWMTLDGLWFLQVMVPYEIYLVYSVAVRIQGITVCEDSPFEAGVQEVFKSIDFDLFVNLKQCHH